MDGLDLIGHNRFSFQPQNVVSCIIFLVRGLGEPCKYDSQCIAVIIGSQCDTHNTGVCNCDGNTVLLQDTCYDSESFERSASLDPFELDLQCNFAFLRVAAEQQVCRNTNFGKWF